VNKYLHTVASVGFLFTLNYDARNHELKPYVHCWSSCKVSDAAMKQKNVFEGCLTVHLPHEIT